VTSRAERQALTKALLKAVIAAREVFTHPEWDSWANACTSSRNLEKGAAIEASAVAGAEADRESGRRHFAAWAAAGEVGNAHRLCEAAQRSADRARES